FRERDPWRTIRTRGCPWSGGERAMEPAPTRSRPPAMPKSDRAFRALARTQPDVVAKLLSAVAPGVLPPGAVLKPDDIAPTHLDAVLPELDADFAVRAGAKRLAPVECQGSRDRRFARRAVWYHIGFVLRNRGKRRVRTVALWLTSPPTGQPRDEM